MPTNFNESGCKRCRDALAGHGRELSGDVCQDLKSNNERQARLIKCKYCGSYWEDPNGAYPRGLSVAEAREFYGVS